jgi:hypothetical protein
MECILSFQLIKHGAKLCRFQFLECFLDCRDILLRRKHVIDFYFFFEFRKLFDMPDDGIDG